MGSIFSLTQLILSPTQITCSSSCIIDHILVGFPDGLIQQGILNVRLYDHQLIYCKLKITWTKRGGHKEIKFCSLQYTVDGYDKVLCEVKFPNYETFDNINDTYSNFIGKLIEVIDKVAPF